MIVGKLNKFKNDLLRKYENGTMSDWFAIFWLLLPYALMFSLFVAIPVAIAIGLSLTYFNSIQFPEFQGLLNYITLLTQDEIFLKYVLPNTFKYALIVGPGGYFLSFLLAWMLAQIQVKARTVLALGHLYTIHGWWSVYCCCMAHTVFR
jgi:multiple sugar transport system permease protein